jgi:AcrR family transcriptional regulator
MSEPYSEAQKRITKEAVLGALVKLLAQKPFAKITITEITKVAGVSRTAFYRNYAAKEDIVLFHMDDLSQDLARRLLEPGLGTKAARIRAFFAFFGEHRAFVSILTQAELTPLLYENFCHHVTEFFREHTDKLSQSALTEKYLPQYIASGLFRVLVVWARDGGAESVDDMSRFVFELTGS